VLHKYRITEFYSMEDYKKLLTDLYSIHDPERVKQIDYFLEKYKGKEKQFYTRQKENYENKKPVSESKKIIEEALERIKSRSTEVDTETEKTPIVSAEKPMKPLDDKKDIAATEQPIKEKKEVVQPKSTKEKKFDSPIIDKPIEKKSETDINIPLSRTSSVPKDRVLRDPFPEKPEPGTPHVSVPPPLKQSKKDIWSDENKKNLSSEAPASEPEISINKKYFLSIFGMVVLSITLIMIVYFTFFTKSDNRAVGVVKKPEGMSVEKSVDATPNKTTISEAKPIVEEKNIEPVITDQEQVTPTTTDEIPVKAEKKETVQQKPSKSLWAILFPKKEKTAQQTNNVDTKTKEQKPTTISTSEKPIVEKKETVPQNNKEAVKTPAQRTTTPYTTKRAITTIEQPIAEEKEIIEEPVAVKKEIIEEPAIEEKEIVEVVKDPESKSNLNTNGVRITKESLNLPAYFVACYAVKTERQALNKINYLKSKGFDACYYWIPDFAYQGNPYFKVVIGPFTNLRDTYRKLTPVQERAEFDAYILTLK
jgi:hypothetical protein